MQHDARSKMMAEEQIPKILTKFAIPAIISMLIAAVYNVVDTLFVGRIGTEAIGATSIAFPLFMLFSTFVTVTKNTSLYSDNLSLRSHILLNASST